MTIIKYIPTFFIPMLLINLCILVWKGVDNKYCDDDRENLVL